MAGGDGGVCSGDGDGVGSGWWCKCRVWLLSECLCFVMDGIACGCYARRIGSPYSPRAVLFRSCPLIWGCRALVFIVTCSVMFVYPTAGTMLAPPVRSAPMAAHWSCGATLSTSRSQTGILTSSGVTSWSDCCISPGRCATSPTREPEGYCRMMAIGICTEKVCSERELKRRRVGRQGHYGVQRTETVMPWCSQGAGGAGGGVMAECF